MGELKRAEPEMIEWAFKGIASNHERLSERQLEIAISLESQWKSKGWLSDAQLDLLEKIYKESA